MRYQMFTNERGERLWLPILAGAAIISAPFWLNNKCCQNQQYMNYPNPQYQYNYTYPMTYPYPLSYPYPYPYPIPINQ